MCRISGIYLLFGLTPILFPCVIAMILSVILEIRKWKKAKQISKKSKK